jgi:hypothetical protein
MPTPTPLPSSTPSPMISLIEATEKAKNTIKDSNLTVASKIQCGFSKNPTDEQKKQMEDAKNNAIKCTEDFINQLKNDPSKLDGTVEKWFGFKPSDPNQNDNYETLKQKYGLLKDRLKDSELYYVGTKSDNNPQGVNEGVAASVEWLSNGAPCPETRIGDGFFTRYTREESLETYQERTVIHEAAHGGIRTKGTNGKGEEMYYRKKGSYERNSEGKYERPQDYYEWEDKDGNKQRIQRSKIPTEISMGKPKDPSGLPDAYANAVIENCDSG